VLESDRSLVLDADGLNILAQIGTISALSQRQAPTILYAGEFKRLFNSGDPIQDRVSAVRSAAQMSGSGVIERG